ncbi:Glutathione S-transferase domain-containing protein [Burkholderia sp. lig30]|jgi:glutathione S-transferase|uniref:glutathione S-transferase family protein n=1 Tax=Burkholderia sp. lig30 TaxID=1192124 RepID=UPI000461BD23|nr:glutathione S-transferase [Burkholderia sp. lig30]KDB06963.1 Glutathione S-transferase domain-containing protein [Burkholderia sp. lig30]
MKLYYWPKTRAFRALWMLEEIGTQYELVPIDLRANEQGSDAFTRVNPMAKLPALDDGGVPFAESGAVLLYLADRFPGTRLGIAPGDPLRGRFLQWLFFTPSCVEPAMAEKFTGASGNPVAFGWGDIARVQRALVQTLADTPWLVGGHFTAADLLLASTLKVAFDAHLLPHEGVLGEYVARAEDRDGYRRAMEIERREAERLLHHA